MAKTQWTMIAEHLSAEIASGRLQSGARFPTEMEIAASYSVSRPTANRAMQELKRKGYIARRPGSGTVVLSQTLPRTGQVAILINMLAGRPQSEHIRGIQEALPDDFHMLLWDTREDATLEARYLRRAAEHVDAIFCWPTCSPVNTPLLQEFAGLTMPLILLDCMPPGIEADAFMTDNAGSTAHAVSFLKARGHQRIAFFGTSDRPILSVQDRCRGFLDAARAGGDPNPERSVRLFTLGMDWNVWMGDALTVLMQGADPVTAIFCEQDSLVNALLEQCDARGIRVPEDLEVAGFVDLAPLTDRMGQRVHRLVQCGQRIGNEAARHVLTRLNAPASGGAGPQHTVVQIPADFYPATATL